MNVGLIGLGELGTAIANNMIQAGHELVVFDLRKEAVAKCVELGATAAPSAASLADQKQHRRN